LSGEIVKKEFIAEPEINRNFKRIEKRKTAQSYIILGYKIPTRKSKDSYVFDLISAILGRGQSGKLFNEIRTKRGLAYDVGTYYDISLDYGFFCVYADTSKKNINDVIKLFISEIKRLKSIRKKDVEEAKRFLKGRFEMLFDDNKQLADFIAYLENVGIKDIDEYLEKINEINVNDIKKAYQKYLKKYTLVIITS